MKKVLGTVAGLFLLSTPLFATGFAVAQPHASLPWYVIDKPTNSLYPIGPSKPVRPKVHLKDNLAISNYDVSKVTPPHPRGKFNYNKPSYRPWFDDGFNWEQFLQQDGIGKTLIKGILKAKTKVVNLGFITAFDEKVAKTSQSPVVKAFTSWVQKPWVGNRVIPSVGGIIPLWMANWTDAWGAATPPQHQGGNIYKFLTAIRTAGKDFVFSFGGWNNDSLAMQAYLKHYTAKQLADVYATIIHKLNLQAIDFDVEGTEDGKTDDYGNKHPLVQGQAAQKLRIKAINLLKRSQYCKVHITFTYPALVNGLKPFALNRVAPLLKNNKVAAVNIMPFDTVFLKHYNTRISLPGEEAINAMSAVNATTNKLKRKGVKNPYHRIGLIMMQGVNDTKNEVFTLTDQALAVDFAVHQDLASYGTWSTLDDMEQTIWSHSSLHPGHKAGKLWTYNDMLQGTGQKDSYSGGLLTSDFAYSNIAQHVSTKTLYNFHGHIDIDRILWQEIKKRGIVPDVDPSHITPKDITALFSNTFFFPDNSGFGTDIAPVARTRLALQNELDYTSFRNQYLDHHLK